MKPTNLLTVQRAMCMLAVAALLITVIPAMVAAAPPQQGPVVYYVRYGDTLFSIAQQFRTTVPAIMAANGLTSYYIYAGQRLVIPVGPTPSPIVACTPPPCAANEVLYCPGYCPNGCGTQCATRTPTPTPLPSFDCTYTVQYRDTVYSIAWRYKVPWVTLMQANYLYSTYLRAGQQLRVPCLTPTPTPFPTYTVQSSDNLFRIAIKYETSLYAIALINGIRNPNLIYAGQTLVIPYPGTVKWPPVPTITPGTPGVLTPTSTPTATATPTATSTSVSTPRVVIMQGAVFLPDTLTINRGETVQWKNQDAISHTVTSGVPGNMTAVFRSGALGSNATFSFTFQNPGVYPYFSELDTNMTGTVTVQ